MIRHLMCWKLAIRTDCDDLSKKWLRVVQTECYFIVYRWNKEEISVSSRFFFRALKFCEQDLGAMWKEG